MTIDFRDDEREMRALLVQKVERYTTSFVSGRSPQITALDVGYEFNQAGWFFIHFDTRALHERDGDWTRHLDRKPSKRDLLERPHWHIALTTTEPLLLILPDGSEEMSGDVSEDQLAQFLGEFIRDVMLRAKEEGVFVSMPRSEQCQLDIGEFYGRWDWPEYYELGKTNLI